MNLVQCIGCGSRLAGCPPVQASTVQAVKHQSVSCFQKLFCYHGKTKMQRQFFVTDQNMYGLTSIGLETCWRMNSVHPCVWLEFIEGAQNPVAESQHDVQHVREHVTIGSSNPFVRPQSALRITRPSWPRREQSADGMAPVSSFCCSSTSCKAIILPISVGIVPEMLFIVIRKVCMLVNKPILALRVPDRFMS